MPPSIVVILFCTASLSIAADWPQWLGPSRDSISKETGLLQQWPKEGPKLLWQVDGVGDGYGAPAVAGGRIYLVSNQGLADETLRAMSVEDGKTIWTLRMGKVGNPDQAPAYPAARSTPTVDGALVYAFSSDGDLVCADRKSVV